MIIVYDSQTGNVERFIKKLRAKNPKLFCIPIEEYHIGLGEYHLITHTTGQGIVPQKTIDFLYTSEFDEEGNLRLKKLVYLLSISSSGNRNWGKKFCLAADYLQLSIKGLLNKEIPILLKFELSGTDDDVDTYLEKLKNYGKQMDSSQ